MAADSTFVNSRESLEDAIRGIREAFEKDKFLVIKVSTGKQRSQLQNAALHLYLGLLADELNAAGYDMIKTLRPGVEIPWNVQLVKDFLWRPLQIAVIGEKSTTKAKRADYSKIHEVLNRHTTLKLGVNIRWPSKDLDDTEKESIVSTGWDQTHNG